ncbi:MAG TPA: hypothetical protein VK420_00760 [Longimicrobium sp.]|nr:hypothetical protein [Longimicrobium sp.]
MQAHRTVIAVLALALAGAFPARAAAQAQLSGRYNYNAGASDDIAQSVNAAVQRMNFAVRPLARRYLARTNRAYRWVEISYAAPRVTISTDLRAGTPTPADGTPVELRRDDGEVQALSTLWANGRLEQTIRAKEAQRVTTYSLSEDGKTLTVAVRLTSHRLPQPVAYRLVYDRAR